MAIAKIVGPGNKELKTLEDACISYLATLYDGKLGIYDFELKRHAFMSGALFFKQLASNVGEAAKKGELKEVVETYTAIEAEAAKFIATQCSVLATIHDRQNIINN